MFDDDNRSESFAAVDDLDAPARAELERRMRAVEAPRPVRLVGADRGRLEQGGLRAGAR